MKKIFTKSIITTLVCSMLVVTAAGCSNGTNAESSDIYRSRFDRIE